MELQSWGGLPDSGRKKGGFDGESAFDCIIAVIPGCGMRNCMIDGRKT